MLELSFYYDQLENEQKKQYENLLLNSIRLATRYLPAHVCFVSLTIVVSPRQRGRVVLETGKAT